MLLKAEKILTRDNVLMDMSSADMYKIVRRELAEKMIDQILEKDYMKVEVCDEMSDSFGKILKIRASIRVYNPDD